MPPAEGNDESTPSPNMLPPWRREEDRLADDGGRWDERRIHAPGGGIVLNNPITILTPDGNGGYRRDSGDGGRGPHNDEPIPAQLPLTGTESITFIQQIASFTRPWQRVFLNVLQFLQSFIPPSFSLSYLNANSDTPPTQLFTVPSRAMFYNLAYSLSLVQVDSVNAADGTLTIFFVPVDGASTPITHSVLLKTGTATTGFSVMLPVQLAANSVVSFQMSTGSHAYGSAQYNLIVSAIPLCNNAVPNNLNNLLL